MKILVVNTVPYKGNGVTNVIYQYYKEIQCDDFQFDFVGINAPNLPFRKKIEEDNGKFFVLPFRNRNPIKYIVELIQICQKGKYDVVHAHGNSSTLALEALAAELAKVPVRIVHGHSVSTNSRIVHTLLKPMLLKCATTYVACSKEAGEFLYGKRNFLVLNNAFSVNDFRFSEENRRKVRKELKIDEKTVVIGNVSTLTESKNHKFLIQVFSEYKKQNRNSILLLVGKGPYEKEIRKYANLNLDATSVFFLGERADVSKMLSAFDVFVFPSQYEGLGISLLEAQANGLPVLATAESIPEIVKVNNNFCFLKLDNPKMWAEQIIETDMKRDMGGVEHVKNKGYDIKENACILKALYKKEKKDECFN